MKDHAMENDELIELPETVAVSVDFQLNARFGIDKWEEYGGDIAKFRFSKEELSKIQELNISDPEAGDLACLEKFPNLKSLIIAGSTDNTYVPPSERKSISDDDVACIEKCRNLENLSIINQPNITEVDLSGMSKLSELNISNNMNLEDIHGIDCLTELNILTCFGNNSLQNVSGLDKAITKNKEHLEELNLDVLLFPKAIKYNTSTGAYNQEALDALDYVNGTSIGCNNVKWCDDISNVSTTSITHPNMLKMHNKACQILGDVCPRVASVPDTVVAVEQYLAQNVTYDLVGLVNGHQKMHEIQIDDNKLKIRDGVKYGANTAFDCLMRQSCVCEGYTKGEQYLLGLKGIKSRSVACFVGEDTLGMSDPSKNIDFSSLKLPEEGYHSIICIDGYYGLYSDPCANATRCQLNNDKSLPYTLLTKEEMSKDHMLSFEERKIGEHQQTTSRSQIAESIEYNELFRNSRKSEVNNQKAAMKQNVVGLVRGADGRAY